MIRGTPHPLARADRKLIVVCLESDWLFARDIENGGLAKSGVPCLCGKRLLSAWSCSNSFLWKGKIGRWMSG